MKSWEYTDISDIFAVECLIHLALELYLQNSVVKKSPVDYFPAGDIFILLLEKEIGNPHNLFQGGMAKYL